MSTKKKKSGSKSKHRALSALIDARLGEAEDIEEFQLEPIHEEPLTIEEKEPVKEEVKLEVEKTEEKPIEEPSVQVTEEKEAVVTPPKLETIATPPITETKERDVIQQPAQVTQQLVQEEPPIPPSYQQEVAITVETGASDPTSLINQAGIDPTLLEAVQKVRVTVMKEKPKWEELYVGRYVSLERKVSERLDQISQRKGDIQKHINNALKLYFQVIGYPLD